MSIYHCSIKIISRSDGKSAVASSAYRSGEKLMDDRTGLVHDFTKKRGVVFTEVALPAHAPPEYADRNVLWNAVEKAEKKSNAQLAREIEVALPKELSRECQIEIVRRYVQDNFVSVGMCADWALHDKGDGNPHAHIMLTMRGIKPDGTWAQKEKKIYALDEDGNRIPLIDPATGEQKLGKRNEKLWKRITVEPNDWNEHSKAEIWRKSWADICNEYLSLEQQIDHRSYKRQELDLEPTIHEGYRARKMEKAGFVSNRCEYNRIVKAINSLKTKWLQTVRELQQTIVQTGYIFFVNKDVVATIPDWFLNRGRNVMNISNLLCRVYQWCYEYLAQYVHSYVAVGIIALVSVGIAAGVFVLAKIAFDRITEKCDDRWQYYKNTGVAELRKAVSVALCVISVTLSMLSVSLIPVDINVLSWWLILSAGLNFLYHGSCKGSYH